MTTLTQSAHSLYLEGVRIALKGETLIKLDACVNPGEVLTVMGPSGSGKSSLLAYIAGYLDRAFEAEGRVLLGGACLTDLPIEQRRVGVLFQDPLLFPHMSVAGNIMFALPHGLRGRKNRQRAAEQALASVGLDGYGANDPETLSGGQKARVALMRVLAAEPCVLLLDEPFSKLDTKLRDQVRRLVFDQAQARMLPVVMVTHDESDAMAAGGHIVHVEV